MYKNRLGSRRGILDPESWKRLSEGSLYVLILLALLWMCRALIFVAPIGLHGQAETLPLSVGGVRLTLAVGAFLYFFLLRSWVRKFTSWLQPDPVSGKASTPVMVSYSRDGWSSKNR